MPKNETTETFAERLADLIADKNISLEKIGKEIGISKSTLSKYTNDEAEAPIGNLVKLANYFNVSADYLLGISEAKTNNKKLQFVCDYTGLSAEAIKKICNESNKATFLNGTLQKKSVLEKYTGIDVYKIFLKCRDDFIISDDFTQIVECLAVDTLLCEYLKEFKKRDDENKLDTLTAECYLFLEKVSGWKNQHRLNLFNAQDAVNTFLKKYTGIEDLDKRFYDDLISKVAKKVNLF